MGKGDKPVYRPRWLIRQSDVQAAIKDLKDPLTLAKLQRLEQENSGGSQKQDD